MARIEADPSILPNSSFADVIHSLCSHIAAPKQIEDSGNKSTSNERMRAIALPEAVCRAYSASITLARLQDDSRIVNDITACNIIINSRHAILLWLKRVLGRPEYIEYIREKHPSKPIRPWDVCSILLHAVVHSENENVRESFRSERMVYLLVLHQWTIVDDHIPPKRTQKQELLKWLVDSHLQLRLASVLKRNLIHTSFRREVLEKWLELVNNDADIIAHSTVIRLQRTIRLGYEAATNIGVMTDLVLCLESASRATNVVCVHSALMKNGTIPALSRSLKLLTNCLQNATNPHFKQRISPNLKETINATLHFLCHLPELKPRAVIKVRQSIRTKDCYISTLQTIATCAALGSQELDKSMLSGVNHILTWTLPAMTLSYCVLGDLVKFVKSWSPNGLYNLAITNTAESQTHDSWRAFRGALMERAIFKALFDRSRSKVLLLCDGCNNRFARSALKTCSSCKYRRYCSLECQANNWRVEGHRHECKVYKERIDNYALSPVDTDFIIQFAIFDVRHCYPGLRKLASRTHPKVPFDRLIIIADYTYTPQSGQIGHRDFHPMPGCGAVFSFLIESELDEVNRKKRSNLVPREGSMFALVRYKWDSITIGVGVPVSPHKGSRIIKRQGWTREMFRIDRPARYGAMRKHGLGPHGKDSELHAVQIETVEWDEVDEIWASVQQELEGREELEGTISENPSINFWDVVTKEATIIEAGGQRIGSIF